MFSAQLSATVALAMLASPALAQWLDNGPAEWAARCALGAEASGEFVCFTYSTDITQVATTGSFQGYANTGGTSFALVPAGNGVGEGTLMSTADRQVNIEWEGDGGAHVVVQKMQDGGWAPMWDQEVKNPGNTYTFVL